MLDRDVTRETQKSPGQSKEALSDFLEGAGIQDS